MKSLNLLIAMALSLAFMAGLVNAEVSATLINPGNSQFNQTNDQVFEIYVYFLNDMNASSMNLWSNFSGTWQINESNSTEIVNGSHINITVTDLADGSYVWNINVTDNATTANHTYADSSNYTLVIDTTNPGAIYIGITPNGGMACPQKIDVEATDTNWANCTLEFRGTNETISSRLSANICRFTKTSTSDGSFNVTVVDRAGRSTKTATRTYLACAEGYNPQYQFGQQTAGQPMDKNTKTMIAIIAILIILSQMGGKKKRKR